MNDDLLKNTLFFEEQVKQYLVDLPGFVVDPCKSTLYHATDSPYVAWFNRLRNKDNSICIYESAKRGKYLALIKHPIEDRNHNVFLDILFAAKAGPWPICKSYLANPVMALKKARLLALSYIKREQIALESLEKKMYYETKVQLVMKLLP